VEVGVGGVEPPARVAVAGGGGGGGPAQHHHCSCVAVAPGAEGIAVRRRVLPTLYI
jgi:hypothetical protein